MSTNSSGSRRPLITVLHVGSSSSTQVPRLQQEGICVFAVESAARGLRLLRNFRVAAVICELPDLPAVARFVATRTPVILLAGKDAEWGGPEVTVVSRDTSAAEIAALVRRIATVGEGEGARRVA